MVYKWVVGNGAKVRFWEDQWLGGTSLAILFWDIYFVCHQQGVTIRDVWDGVNIKLTFRRVFDNKMMEQWYQIEQIIRSIHFSEVDDALVWELHSSGLYTSQSLYAIINFRGVTPVYIPAVWNLNVPPRVHVFLWLMYHNKLLTRDNLCKRQEINDKTCLLCSEDESVHHLFFSCDIVKLLWREISETIQNAVVVGFESMARLWISNKKNWVINMVNAAFMWNMWKLRNDICFGRCTWSGLQVVWFRLAKMLRR
jgi:hypothetical protein